MNTVDPTGHVRQARYFWIDPIVERVARRPEDIALARVPLLTAIVLWPPVVFFLVTEEISWWTAGIYVVVAMIMADKFGAFIHEMVHARIFRDEYRFIPHVINWGLMPLIGMGPSLYRGLHIGMHHVEDNGPDDFHSTMYIQRDRLSDHLKLWLKIVFLTDIAVLRYLHRKRRFSMFRATFIGTSAHLVAIVGCSMWNLGIALTVLILPMMFVRTVAALINSCEHLLIDPDAPRNLFRNSTLCINNAFNQNYFNAAYHATHHLRPSVPWTELPSRFTADLAKYHRERALVFSGITHIRAFILLVRKDYTALANHCVQDPENVRPLEEIAETIRWRARRIA